MKSKLTKLALTATLGLAITFTLNACGKGGEKDKYAGIYEYAYPYGSYENPYIVLSEENGKVTGFYYGTSDEFDQAREGYAAEYFVAPMTNLKINGDTITFELKVKESDFLTNLIDLKITSTQEAIKAGNTNGQGPIRIDHKNMVGYISADKKTILIKRDEGECGYGDDREFVKTETINRTEPPPPVEYTVDPLYMAIHQAILAFKFKEEQRLNLIKDFGVAYVNAPGIYKTFSLSNKVPFGVELSGDIGYNEISDSYYINYEAFPTFSCEEEKWNKSGVYLDTTRFDGTLASIARQNNEFGISDWSAKEIKKFEELGKSSREIFITDTEGHALNFILTLWEGEWYLTAVIEVDPCGA